ncbi:conjugative transposon protein TraM [Parabacteroides johnsonii]|uniref:Conjugative transposon protein TraM n=1 Tax=Parabacteroides johnsonii TaxID=387661 RepID=A0A9Q5STC6_9BACT|nr:conjugative transposon protein TraM [Parabacteroides johnsonii]OUO06294.1 conjugative transposon protein TraM [Parabacteroides johnsonii]
MEENMNNEDIVLEEGTVQVEEPTEEIQEIEDAPIPPQEKKEKERKELTPAEIQRRKKMLVYPLIFLVFAGAMWLIFAPSSDDKENQMQKGFNIDVPLPNEKGLMDDKKKAYEQDAFEKQRKTKMGTLQDFEIAIGQEESSPIGVLTDNMVEEDVPHTSNSSVRSSAVAYQDMNRQLGTFYQEPKKEEDDQKQLELEWRIQELERMQEEAQQRKTTANEQLELMEKSYQLAAKYMPGGKSGEQEVQSATNFGNGNTGNTQVIAAPVRQVKEQVVSILAHPMSDADFVNVYSKPRNWGFNTVQTAEESISKNTIKASVYRTITLTDGKEVQLRLLEPMMVGKQYIPSGTIVTGTAKIGEERMEIKVTSVSHGGNITPVNLGVYDIQGMKGVAVPNSEELNAAKEMASNMGSSLGTSITITEDAGAQLAADLGKGVIQGASQYLAKKFRTVKVTLKANHEFYLLPER